MSDEILKQILTELQTMNQRIGALENGQETLGEGQNELRAQIHREFAEVKADLRIIKDQTAKNSELQSPVSDVQKEVEELRLDLKILKRAITNQ
ncbi:hypothetical protein [Aneurinibacillus tyrosinisolvens]|uniref:hypothetical protein n=1 Tax=Aneurinibacillus tyrosinisolvens TaxID=1443435 RepID=UPI00063FB915|nr:hypothetical protein [Aneurinibacillus tyrosinisolvens]